MSGTTKLNLTAEAKHPIDSQYKELPTSATADLDEDGDGEIPDLDVSDCTWFSMMLVLLFGFALFLCGSCLYNFPAAALNYTHFMNPDRLEEPSALKLVIGQYTILLNLCGLIIFIFASVCLAVRMDVFSRTNSSPPRWLLSSKWTPFLEQSMWLLLLALLVVAVATFDWFLFDGNWALYYIYYLY